MELATKNKTRECVTFLKHPNACWKDKEPLLGIHHLQADDEPEINGFYIMPEIGIAQCLFTKNELIRRFANLEEAITFCQESLNRFILFFNLKSIES